MDSSINAPSQTPTVHRVSASLLVACDASEGIQSPVLAIVKVTHVQIICLDRHVPALAAPGSLQQLTP